MGKLYYFNLVEIFLNLNYNHYMNKTIAALAFFMVFSCLPAVCEEATQIAVLELIAKNTAKEEASIITDFIVNKIVETKKFKVLERENIEKILNEQYFQMSGCTTSDCAVKAGKLLNVQKMIIGTFSRIGDKFYISARMVNVSDGTIIKAITEECLSTENLKNTSEAVGLKLADMEVAQSLYDGELSRGDIETLEKLLKIMQIRKKYYTREVRNSWFTTGIGVLLCLNGAIWFNGSDRVMFSSVGAGLAAIGAVSLEKTSKRLKQVNIEINATQVRLNLSF